MRLESNYCCSACSGDQLQLRLWDKALDDPGRGWCFPASSWVHVRGEARTLVHTRFLVVVCVLLLLLLLQTQFSVFENPLNCVYEYNLETESFTREWTPVVFKIDFGWHFVEHFSRMRCWRLHVCLGELVAFISGGCRVFSQSACVNHNCLLED